jgi:hypothetical protein
VNSAIQGDIGVLFLLCSALADLLRKWVDSVAEREGFEPPIPVKVCLISSQVHSTALPSLRAFIINYLQLAQFYHSGTMT